LRFVDIHNNVDAASVVLMTISLFGFLGNVMIDYNWGTNFIANSFALIYWMTLRWMVPFPIGYWGVGAAVYFALFLLSFAVLNRRERTAKNLLETVRLGSVVVVLFEIGVFYFVPDFMNKWVIDAVRGTVLGAFTNWDLLVTSITLLIVSQMMLSWRRSKRSGVDVLE
jgi:hypothetical protein